MNFPRSCLILLTVLICFKNMFFYSSINSFISLSLITMLVVTKSLCRFVTNQEHFNMKSALYLGQSYYIIIIITIIIIIYIYIYILDLYI